MFISISYVFAQTNPFNMADFYNSEGRFERALKEYANFEHVDSLKHTSLAGQAFCLSALGDTNAAINKFKQSIRVYPDFYEAKYQLGYLYQELGLIDSATTLYEQSIKLFEKQEPLRYKHAHAVYNNLAVIYFENYNKIDSSIFYYNKALAYHPNYFDALKNRGKAHLYNYSYEKAQIDLEKAFSMDSTNHFSRYFLFYTYYNLAKFEDAYNLIKTDSTLIEDDLDKRMAGMVCYLNQDNTNSLDYYLKIKKELLTSLDLTYISYLSLLTDKSNYCDYFKLISFSELKESDKTLKADIQKYKVIKKQCK